MADRKLSLSTLSPAQKRQDRKRVGRGLGSGKGRYSGRGLKGQKSRAGSHKMRAGFEGGQMPTYMRLPKQRGNTSKDAMPVGPFRTFTQGVNLRDLEARFDAGAEVTPEALKELGLIRSLRRDVKILGYGDLTKKLTVSAHRFSATAREKIEAAGGTVTSLREEEQPTRTRKRRKIEAKKRAAGIATPVAEEAPEETPAEE
jgi:large subunit ribosomal protein L15